ADLFVFKEANSGIFVGLNRRVELKTLFLNPSVKAVAPNRGSSRTPVLILKALRCHQWVKNLLLFLPLIFAHQILKAPLIVNATLGFLAFSFTASAIYII